MDLYPLDLVLAASLAWAMVFLGALPTRLLRLHAFSRLAGYGGAAWFAVALVSPAEILHFYFALGVVCLYGWHQLRQDNALRGKFWLILAAGLGVSLGVLLVFAVTPGAFPPQAPLGMQIGLLVIVHLAGAVAGLAVVLYFFTRREATLAGLPPATIERYSRMLLTLVVLRAVFLLFAWLGLGTGIPPRIPAASLTAAALLTLLVLLPGLAWFARRRVISPQPSRSGAVLLLVAVLATGTEILLRLTRILP